jgi:hypothetical protein
MVDKTDLRIAFISWRTFEDGSVRGGMLVTDELTRPYEFRATSPVKPTGFQKILYAHTMKAVIYGDLIGIPLLKSSKEKIDLVLTQDQNILGVRPKVSFPIALLYRPKQASADSSEGVPTLLSIAVHNSFKSEENWINAIVNQMTTKIDLLEPFDRIRTALGEVEQQKPEQK